MTKFSSFIVVLLLVLASFTAHAQEYPRGDVDRDGAVNISDVTCLIDNLLKGVPEGDVDQDGAVNISDVTSLIDYLLKGSWSDDPVTPPDNHEWVDLGLPSGTLWATCNIGASAPEEYGDYFAWGETESKETFTWENYKWCEGSFDTMTKYCTDSGYGSNGFTDGKTELDPEDDADYVNWGPSWRMPTHEQQRELVEQCTWKWTTRNGVYGQQGTGPNGNTIFLPAAGWVIDERSLQCAGSYGCCWSRTLFPIVSDIAYIQYFFSGDMTWYSPYARNVGCSVRAVRVPQN
jgi:hypothetical protein